MSPADVLKREQAKAKRDALVLTMLQQLRAAGLELGLVRELVFHPTRKWRFDLAWPREKVAVEVDGAVFTGGRHTRGAGFEEDCAKLNEAALLGWSVLRVTSNHIGQGLALQWVERLIGAKRA